MADREINIVLRAKNLVATGLSQAQNEISKFGESAATLVTHASVAIGALGTAISGVAVKALTAFAAQDKAVQNLNDAFIINGENAGALVPKYVALANAMQDQAGVGDELTLQRIANLRLYGVEIENLEMAAKAVAAMTRAGMGEEQAQKAITVALKGNFDALGKYIPALRIASTEAEKAKAVNDFLTLQWEMQKKDLNTLGGSWEALKGRIGDAWETIGETIANNGNVVAGIKAAEQAVKDFIESFSQYVSGGGLKLFAEEMRNSFEKATIYAKGFFYGGLIEPASQAFQYIVNLAKSHMSIFEAVIGKKGIKEAFNDIVGAFMGKGVVSNKAFATMFDSLESEEKKHAENIKKINADAVNAIVEGAKEKKNAEVKALEQIEIAVANLDQKREEAAKKEKDRQEEINKIRSEIESEEAKRLDVVAEQQKQKWQEIANSANVEPRVMVQDFIDKNRKENEMKKEYTSDARRFDNIMKRTKTGAKMSKQDAEFVDAFNKAQNANVALENLKQLEKDPQVKKLGDIEKAINDHQKKLDELLTMG